jgi:flavin prenyltransferase
MAKNLIIGITGASGVIYGVTLLKVLKNLQVETHLVISKGGVVNIELETDYQLDQVLALADHVYDDHNLAAAIASGSFLTDGMIVAPCTIKTLSGIAHSYNDNLLVRAADVTLKERRKLLLMVRETPLHKGHLQLMLQAADSGAHILPPFPAFYTRPKTIEDIVNQTVGKMLDYFQIEHNLFKRWC